jgi:hypothetical protein
MSTEKLINTEQNSSSLMSPELKENKLSVVDINVLIARVRNEKQEENKVNLVFFCLFSALILIVGILLSL